MKRFLSKMTFAFILTITMMVSLFVIVSFAADAVVEDVEWETTFNPDGNTVTITGVTINSKKTKSFSIPQTITIVDDSGIAVEYIVTAIGNDAFVDSADKIYGELSLPSSLRTIGNNAFAGTHISGDIIIPNNVSSIGTGAFSKLTDEITSFTISKNLTSIPEKLLYQSNFTGTLEIANNVTSIGKNAFAGTKISGALVIPHSVTSIEERAFENCTRLTKVEIYSEPSVLNASTNKSLKIGNYAFYDCTSISSITLGSGVSSIGNYAFANNDSLSTIKYNALNVSDLSASSSAFSLSGLKTSGITLTINKNVKKIPNHLFYVDKVANSPRLTNVIFEDGSFCETIGTNAFANSYYLAKIVLPNSLTKISGSAFKSCYSLTSVTLGTNITTIENDAFKDCYKLVEVYNLSDLSINAKSDSYGCIGKYAIDVFTSLSEESKLITTSSNFIMYESDVCYLLTYVGAKTTVDFPDDCNGKPYEIYEYAFYNYPYEINIVLSNETKNDKKISAISKYAFYGAPIVGKIAITNSVEYIGEYAFSNCTGKITGLVLPSKITEIKEYTFENSHLIANFKIPKGVTSIGEKAFSGTYIHGDFEIPEGVTTIGANAFYKCFGISSMKLPSTLKEIKSNTFNECLALTTINVENIKVFGNNCFANCQSLLHVNFGDDVTSISSEAFKNCYSLSGKIDLSNVRSINENAFRDCKRIDSFVLPNININFFNFISGCSGLSAVYTVEGNPTYFSDDGVLFKNETITDADGNTTVVEVLVFYPYLKDDDVYIIPSTTTIIGENAFKNAKYIEKILIPNTVTEIRKGAFSNSAITTAFIPDSITKLNSDVFANCSDLEWVVLGKNIKSTESAFTNTTATIYSRNEYLSRPSGVADAKYKTSLNFTCIDHLYGYCDKAPTCEGYGYNQCTFCDKVAYVKELGHSGAIINKVELSCTTDAYYEVDCVQCGEIIKISTATSSGHISNYTTTVMTSTTPGYMIGNCSVCHQTYLALYTPFEESPCDSHKSTKSIVISVASCKTNGLELVYCKDCGALVGEPIITPKSPCKYVLKSRIESTCSVNGQIIEECSVATCKNLRVTTLDLAPHTHSWYTVSNNKGYEYSTCAVCGLFESHEVDYSVYDLLLSQVSEYYETYYAPDTVALLAPIWENRDLNLTQDAVDYNVDLLRDILSNVKYNVTDIPVVFIEYEGEFHPDDANETRKRIPKEYGDANIFVAYIDENGERQTEAVDFDAKIKGRGNSTYNRNKCPYNIKFSNKVDLFGMGAGKKYCLMANLYDQTLIRNAVVIEFAKSIGLDYTPNYQMVEVYLNGRYDGVYMLTTPVDVDENRVAIDETDDFLLEVENKNAASEGEIYISCENKLPDTYMKLLVNSPENMGAESYSALISSFYQINIAIYSGDWDLIQQHVDVESMAKYYLVHEYLKEVDICYDSTRLYIEDGKLHGGPVWDFDFGLGNVVSGGGNNSSHTAYNNGNADYVNKNGGAELGVVQGIYNEHNQLKSDSDIPDNSFASATGYWARCLWENGNANGFFNELYMNSDEFIDLVAKYVQDYDMEMRLLYEDYKVDKSTTYTNTIDSKFYKNDDFTAARIRNWQVYAVTGKYSSTSNIKISYNHAIDYLKEWLQRRHEWIITAYVETDARP